VTHPPPLAVIALKAAPNNNTQSITTFYGILLLYVLIQQNDQGRRDPPLHYIFYCSLFAAGWSLASRTEDAQNIAFPLQLPMLIAYFLSFPVLFSGSASTRIVILAYLPPSAPLAMPALAAVGRATPWMWPSRR
jgi:hypothetical protein